MYEHMTFIQKLVTATALEALRENGIIAEEGEDAKLSFNLSTVEMPTASDSYHSVTDVDVLIEREDIMLLVKIHLPTKTVKEQHIIESEKERVFH